MQLLYPRPFVAAHPQGHRDRLKGCALPHRSPAAVHHMWATHHQVRSNAAAPDAMHRIPQTAQASPLQSDVRGRCCVCESKHYILI